MVAVWQVWIFCNTEPQDARFNFFWGGVAGSEDFAFATLPTTPLIFKAKFKISVTVPS